MKEGDVVLLQNTRFRGAEETKNGEEFSKELADLADIYVCDAFGFFSQSTCFCSWRYKVHQSKRRRKCSWISDGKRNCISLVMQ